jgi:hypothetical protein
VDEVVGILKNNLGKSRDEALVKVASYTLEAMNKRAKKGGESTKPSGEFAKLVGEWVGPTVELMVKAKKQAPDVKVKGQLYLRFSEVRNKQLVDLGYVRAEDGVALGVFRSCQFELKQVAGGRQIVIRNGNDDGSIVLAYEELADDVRRIASTAKAAVPDVAGLVDLSGEWSRLTTK